GRLGAPSAAPPGGDGRSPYPGPDGGSSGGYFVLEPGRRGDGPGTRSERRASESAERSGRSAGTPVLVLASLTVVVMIVLGAALGARLLRGDDGRSSVQLDTTSAPEPTSESVVPAPPPSETEPA